MPFQNFPYTNFQNLNLDWILKKVKEMETVAEETQELADSVDQRFNTYDDALTNMNADIVDIENDIANGRYVPASTDQIGKYLKATEQNSYEWDDVFQIPDPANEENGKVLTVLSGVAQWATMGGVGGTKIYYYNANNQTPFNYNIFNIIEEIGIAGILPIVTDSLSNNGSKLYFPVFWNTEWTAGDTDPKLIFASIHEDRTSIDILSMAQPVHSGTPTVTLQSIAIGGGGSGDGIYVINAEYVAQNQGFSFDKNTAQIVTAINAGMLPVVLSLDDELSDNVIAKMFVLDNYSYDGEDSYFSFYRATGTQIEELRKAGSESYAYIHTFNYLPASAAADSGKFLRVNSLGMPVWDTVPAAENASFGGA